MHWPCTHMHKHTHTHTHTRAHARTCTHTHATHRQELLSCFVVACCHGYCTSQCSDLAQLAPTSKGLSISLYVQKLTLHWITLSTLLMMAHKAETAVQGWSVDPVEAVILTHAHIHTHTCMHATTWTCSIPPPPPSFSLVISSWSASISSFFFHASADLARRTATKSLFFFTWNIIRHERQCNSQLRKINV